MAGRSSHSIRLSHRRHKMFQPCANIMLMDRLAITVTCSQPATTATNQRLSTSNLVSHQVTVDARKTQPPPLAADTPRVSTFTADLTALLFAHYRSDIERRLALLRAATRPGEALTEGREPTAAGHIASAITKLEREKEKR